MSLWERFNNIATVDEVEVAKAVYTPVEAGKYYAILNKIEAGESSSGLPMLKASFKLESGRLVFVNQVLQNPNYPDMTAGNIARALDFVEKIIGEDIKFTSLGDFAELIENIKINPDVTYVIEVSYADKDTEHKFAQVKIIKREDNNLPD